MKKSFSKIRSIQNSNILLENRYLVEKKLDFDSFDSFASDGIRDLSNQLRIKQNIKGDVYGNPYQVYYKHDMDSNGELKKFTLIFGKTSFRGNTDVFLKITIKRDEPYIVIDSWGGWLDDNKVFNNFLESNNDLNLISRFLHGIGNEFMSLNISTDDISDSISNKMPNLVMNREEEQTVKQSAKEKFESLLNQILMVRDEEDIYNKLLVTLNREIS